MRYTVPGDRSTLAGVAVLAGVAILVGTAHAAPNVAALERGVVRVVAESDDGYGTGTGFIINGAGLVATNHHVVDGGHTFAVLVSGSRTPVEAQVLWADDGVDLALLRTRDLRGEPVTLSSASIEKGSEVFALGFPGLADEQGNAVDATVTKGVIGRLFRGSWGGSQLDVIQHSAPINPGNSGGPLFDACGAVVGVNTQGSGSGRIVRDARGRVIDVMAGVGIYFASGIGELIAVLRSRGERFSHSDTACVAGPAADVEARRQAGEAQRQAEQARQQAEETQRLTEEALQDQQQAQAETQRRVEETTQTTRRLTDALHGLGRQFWTVSALMTLGILITLALALRRPRERILRIMSNYGEKLSHMGPGRRPRGLKRGIAISGFTPDGVPLRVRFPARRFADQGYGLTIGRSPGLVDAVIPGDCVSRRHLRLRWTGSGFEIEDLNSSNGTTVNGRRLQPFQRSPLGAGDVIHCGTLELLVSMA